MIRLLEVLLHSGSKIAGWCARQIHAALHATFQLSADHCDLNQLRYDVRKLKARGLERDGRRYAYRLTNKGLQLARLFRFFHKRLCDPLANSVFHHRPNAEHHPNSELEAAQLQGQHRIPRIIHLLTAA